MSNPPFARWLDRAQHRLARANDEWFGPREFEAARWYGDPVISIVCDDGCLSDLSKVVPVLDAHRVQGVFAPVASWVGTSGHMSAADLRALARGGHEIASHLDHHEPLHRRPEHTWQEAFQSSRAALSDACGTDVTTLVFPHGHNSLPVRQAALEHYDSALTTWRGFNRGVFNRYALRRVPFGSHLAPADRDPLAHRQLINDVLARPAWLIWMVHSANPSHDERQIDRLHAMLLLAAQLGIQVLTIHNTWRHLRNLRRAAQRKNAGYPVEQGTT